MAGSDYNLNLNILGTNNASAALSGFLGALAPIGGIIGGIGSNLANAFGNASFALRNARTEGTITADAMAAAGGNIGKAMLGIGAVAAVAGVALAGVGMVATKMAADFQTGLTQLVTDANESKSNLQMVGDGIKQVSVDTATSTDKLLKGMFIVESAGFHGAAGLQVLKTAAQGARLENSDLAQTTDVLTTAMHDYNFSQAQAVPTMNSLIQTVANGKMHLDQLNASLTNVLPVAGALKVKLSDVEGALATMASSGDRGASAGTHLAMMLKMLSNPAKSAQKEMTAMGLDSIKLAQTMRTSLPDALAMIQNAVAKHFVPGSVEYNRAIAAILGGSKSGIAGLEIMGANFKDLKTNSDSAASSMSHSGKAVQGFADVQNTFNFRMDQAKAALDVMMITIGQQLLPVFTDFAKNMVPIIQHFTDWLTKSGALQVAAGWLASALTNVINVISWLATTIVNVVSFFQQNQWAMDALASVLIAFALVVLPMVIAGLAAMAAAAWAAAVPIIAMALPFIALGLVIAAVVFGIIMAIQHWGAIMDWISNKTEQTNIKIQISDSQAAVKKDQQQKKSAQDTLKNLEKEKADLLAKIKNEHDAAKKAEDQHQLEMTQAQIDGQNARIRAADKDAAAQKAKQKKLHDDLIESQKDLGTRMDDAINTWTKTAEDTFDKWLATMAGNINTWTSKSETSFDNFFLTIAGKINTWTSTAETSFDNFFLTLAGKINTGTATAETDFDNFFLNLAGKFNTWVAGAFNWGHDLIQNIINGINGMIGSLSGAVGNVASTIASMLHFTKPDKGPLKTVDEWMPHLGDTLILGLNNIAPNLQAAAIRAAASVAGPIKGSTDGAMPSHIFDFIGSNYSGYASGMATTAKREQTADNKAVRQAAALSKKETALDAHIQKLENHYNIVVNHTGKGRWTKADATELAKLLAEQTRLQGKSPQTSSGRRN